MQSLGEQLPFTCMYISYRPRLASLQLSANLVILRLAESCMSYVIIRLPVSCRSYVIIRPDESCMSYAIIRLTESCMSNVIIRLSRVVCLKSLSD